ncbi:type II toxin-antitoxin system RelE/ParE family toxin [Streptomyces niveus]|uniref:type II toxin-antitoxin system RelE family toxin n=1 Tax=Streptomyces niveus TaxID=193462 RepID=UPI00371E9A61
MSRYRIQYADQAEASRKAMQPAAREQFEQSMTSKLGADPYGHGSTALKGDRDYREATVAGAFVVYYISAAVLVVTAVRIVH